MFELTSEKKTDIVVFSDAKSVLQSLENKKMKTHTSAASLEQWQNSEQHIKLKLLYSGSQDTPTSQEMKRQIH